MTEPISEAQTYQSIGELSPQAEQTLTHQQAWDGLAAPIPTPLQDIDQISSPTFSKWNQRAGRQELAAGTITPDESFAENFFSPQNDPGDIPPRAGYGIGGGAYDETPTAAINPAPFQQAPDGAISGATAASERSGNSGFVDETRR